MRLSDKVAVITGGGSGIGLAISRAFADEGALVVMAARTASRLNEAAAAIKASGGRAMAIPTDVTDENQVRQMVAQALAEYERIDILVNNAGIPGPTASIADMALDRWNEVLAVNLTGTMLCSREVLKDMMARKSGNIINISSVGGMLLLPSPRRWPLKPGSTISA